MTWNLKMWLQAAKWALGEIFFLVYSKKDTWGSGCIAPFILYLDTRWMWVVSFMLWPLYLRDRAPSICWMGGCLGSTRFGLDACIREENNLQLLLTVLPQFLGHAHHFLLLLYWLRYPGSCTVHKHVEIAKALVTLLEYEEQCLTEGKSYMNVGILSRKW
jgi:hypothetical protein